MAALLFASRSRRQVPPARSCTKKKTIDVESGERIWLQKMTRGFVDQKIDPGSSSSATTTFGGGASSSIAPKRNCGKPC
jgi:hypothetical protein